MKIIKEGMPTPKIYRFNCTHCGCIFDLDYHNLDDRRAMDMGPFMNGDFANSICPCCFERVYGNLLKEEEDENNYDIILCARLTCCRKSPYHISFSLNDFLDKVCKRDLHNRA